ncbi:MAG: DUF4442 domain-containing protein [Spirochaetes bacterium]|nr:MAG: DUF4442 domain-containing protein [Spirochaetota bacterium]
MSTALSIYRRMERLPLGKYFFSRILCLKAPYFGTIRPRFIELRPGYGEIGMKKRRRVLNHLGTVHALAMGNLCELVAGMTLDVTLPGALRWIPVSMNIEYLKLAKTALKAVCEIPSASVSMPGDHTVQVSVTDTSGTKVVRAAITMRVSTKTTRKDP